MDIGTEGSATESVKRHANEFDVFAEKGKRGAGFLLVERKDVSGLVGIAAQSKA